MKMTSTARKILDHQRKKTFATQSRRKADIRQAAPAATYRYLTGDGHTISYLAQRL
jgi:hypothetical protein